MPGVMLFERWNPRADAAIALLPALRLFSRAMLNNVILAGGLLLQGALVGAIFRRGIARRFPAFTAVITFYPLRALLLYTFSGRLDADAYETWQRALDVMEVALVAWLAAEILLRLVRAAGGWSRRRTFAVVALIALASVLAWLALGAASAKEPADRVQIFAGILMIELFVVAWSLGRARGEGARAGLGNLTRIAAGFAAFAVLQFAALAGKAHAVAANASGQYIGWSYVPACGYLAVVAFWLVTLKREA